MTGRRTGRTDGRGPWWGRKRPACSCSAYQPSVLLPCHPIATWPSFSSTFIFMPFCLFLCRHPPLAPPPHCPHYLLLPPQFSVPMPSPWAGDPVDMKAGGWTFSLDGRAGAEEEVQRMALLSVLFITGMRHATKRCVAGGCVPRVKRYRRRRRGSGRGTRGRRRRASGAKDREKTGGLFCRASHAAPPHLFSARLYLPLCLPLPLAKKRGGTQTETTR